MHRIKQIRLERKNEMRQDLDPLFGKKRASTKMATIGPDMAPMTEIQIRRLPPRTSARKASPVEVIPQRRTIS